MHNNDRATAKLFTVTHVRELGCLDEPRQQKPPFAAGVYFSRRIASSSVRRSVGSVANECDRLIRLPQLVMSECDAGRCG
jgi:hypothetical protein